MPSAFDYQFRHNPMARAVRESSLDPPSEQRRLPDRAARLAGADLFVELSRQIRSAIAT
jgi:hypothetical protein